MKRIITLFTISIFLFSAACGPSPEQIATMTASAWTATPVPPTVTPSPTPVPYDVNITVTDSNGLPISGAQVVFRESGNGEPVLADAQGKYSWKNLAGEGATFNITAQGYLNTEQVETLQRGANTITITMKRDPFGMLSTNACAPNEKMLFMEDFQTGNSILQHYENGTMPAQLGSVSGEDGNTVLIHDFTEPKGDYSTFLNFFPDSGPAVFGDAVWRMRFMITEETNWALSWNSAGPNDFQGVTISNSGYGVGFNVSRHITVMRNIWDASGQPLRNIGKPSLGDKVLILKTNEWHYIEISTFQGAFNIWLDGESVFSAQDDTPLPAGGFSIGRADKGIQYFDALSVCGLSGPFTSMQPPVPATSP